MKFVLLVEGKTERESVNFLKRWLDSQLQQPVGVQPVKFEGYSEFRKNVMAKARSHLNSPKNDEIIAVIGLLDLYGPNFYPPELQTVSERYDWAKQDIEREVGDPRFRMFFAVHEYEAWLLSHPAIFPREIQESLRDQSVSPEKVNFDEPPAKLLERLYPLKLRRQYKKAVDGPKLFAKLDTSIAVDRCPYLKRMLQEMRSLAKDRGL
ncbi:MAG: DUF4276 family protein [Planctomycetota bacterium]|nr:DUF4276 family protein [Planctomycetota bacterium]